jgi:hypothetical protein
MDNNKEDFSSSSDIEDAIGAILEELANGDNVDISGLCKTFHRLLKGFLFKFIKLR